LLQYPLDLSGRVTEVLEIVADVHERASGVPEAVSLLGVRVTIRSLTRGDYVLAPGCVVERKTVVDLHLSIGQGRFWHQIQKLRSTGASACLLVEGQSLRLRRGGLRPDSIRGALLAVSDLGVTIVRSEDGDDSAAWLVRLALRRLRGRVADRPVYAQRPKRGGTTPAEQALAAVPGISTTTARALLTRFGSLQNVLSATEKDLSTVAGVGPVRIRALLEMIRQPWPTPDAH
jgi:ERCC4-type nuclease